MPKLPVVAAITNYNMATELEHLLPQVVRQGYDAVFVLDDASTDNSREVVKNFDHGVKFVAGKVNKGAGGNRNRIINALNHDALIHFLDTDVELETENTANLVRKAAGDEPFGFVGGLIKNRAGLQHAWNYGTGPTLLSSVASVVQLAIVAPTLLKHPDRAARFRRWFGGLLDGWPDPLTKPARREVFWCAEANMVVRSDIFAELGGFDERIRETDALELGVRMQERGLPCYFDPLISVRHTEGDVRKYNRDILKAKEMFKIARQYGLSRWLFSAGKPKTFAKYVH